jgi:hypothetical protein
LGNPWSGEKRKKAAEMLLEFNFLNTNSGMLLSPSLRQGLELTYWRSTWQIVGKRSQEAVLKASEREVKLPGWACLSVRVVSDVLGRSSEDP